MILIYKLIQTIVVPIIFGLLICKSIRIDSKNCYLPMLLSLSFLIGLGSISLLLFLLGALQIPITVFKIYTILLVGSSLLTVFIFKNKGIADQGSLKKPPLVGERDASKTSLIFNNIALLALIAFFALISITVFYRSFLVPIQSWDAIFIYALKAKYIYYDQSFTNLIHLAWPSYPLMVPLSEVWVALNLGGWSDQWVKIIFPFGSIAFLTILYYHLRLYLNRLWSLMGVGLLLASPHFVHHTSVSYTDFYMMIYNCTACLIILQWSKSHNQKLLFLASFFSALGIFTKTEGLCYFLIHLSLIFLISFYQSEARGCFFKSLRSILKFALLPLGVFLVYSAFNFAAGTSGSSWVSYSFRLSSLYRIFPTFAQITQALALIQYWQILWYLTALYMLIYKRLPGDIKIVLGIILAHFGLLFVFSVFSSSFYFIGGHYGFFTLPRLILHFFPLSAVFVILTTQYISDGCEKTRILSSASKP